MALIGLGVFSGGLARLTGWPLRVAQLASPAYWCLDGLKAPLPPLLTAATYPGAPGRYQPPILGAGGPVALDCGMLVLQAAALLAAAYAALRAAVARPGR